MHRKEKEKKCIFHPHFSKSNFFFFATSTKQGIISILVSRFEIYIIPILDVNKQQSPILQVNKQQSSMEVFQTRGWQPRPHNSKQYMRHVKGYFICYN